MKRLGAVEHRAAGAARRQTRAAQVVGVQVIQSGAVAQGYLLPVQAVAHRGLQLRTIMKTVR